LIEETDSCFSILQALKDEYGIYSEAIKSEKDKATRLKGISYLLKTGRVFFLKINQISEKILNESYMLFRM